MAKLDDDMKNFAKAMTVAAVRNTWLEGAHAGNFPESNSGDNSDIAVVGPDGSVPWKEVSRISQDEMKALMIDVTNRLYTILLELEQRGDSLAFGDFMTVARKQTSGWNDPHFVEGMIPTIDFRTGKKYE